MVRDRVYLPVNTETNKYLYGTPQNKKYKEQIAIEYFLSLIKNKSFKELNEYDQVTNFFQPSIDTVTKELIDELQENELKRKARIEQLIKDIESSISYLGQLIVGNIDITYYISSVRKYALQDGAKNKDLAIANAKNILEIYLANEARIIKEIVLKISELMGKYCQYVFVDDSLLFDQKVVDELKDSYGVLLNILQNKNVTKKDLVKQFEKIFDNPRYSRYSVKHCRQKLFYKYPHDLIRGKYESKSDYEYRVIGHVRALTINDRLNRFLELLNDEKDYYYIFDILNVNFAPKSSGEAKFGEIIYYDNRHVKSKGYKNKSNIRDEFVKNACIKAMLPFKVNSLFPEMSALKARDVVKTNLHFMKLMFNRDNNTFLSNTLEPIFNKISVSLSYMVLDEDFYVKAFMHTVYDRNKSLQKDNLNNSYYVCDELNEKLNKFFSKIYHKQVSGELTTNEKTLIQVYEKMQKSLEAESYNDKLFYTWNAFEYIAKKIDGNGWFKIIEDIVYIILELVYSQEYRYISHKCKESNEFWKDKSNRLITYAYLYRNKIAHSHLVENQFMISISRGLNFILRNFLSLVLNRIIADIDLSLKDLYFLVKSDIEVNSAYMFDKKSKRVPSTPS